MRAIEWTEELVEAHLAAAAATMQQLPTPQPPGYYNSWPAIVRDAFELSATAEGSTKLGPAVPSAVTEAENALLWLRVLDREDQQIVWARANRRPWKFIEYEYGVERTTGWRRFKTALAVIAAHLNAADRNDVATPASAT